MSFAVPKPVPRIRFQDLVPWIVIAAGASSVLAHDWLAGAAIVLLGLAWCLLRESEGPPVLAFAFSFQWLQLSLGVFYCGIVGRNVPTITRSDYRPMVMVGLVGLLALLLGLYCGRKLVRTKPARVAWQVPSFAFNIRELLVLYVASTLVAQLLLDAAWHYPRFTQALVALANFRLFFLFLLLRRLVRPRLEFGPFSLVVVGEILFGFTSYFASFKEPLFLACLALSEAFDHRKLQHWLLLVVLGCVLLCCGVLWTGIKVPYRRDFQSQEFANSRIDRLKRISELSSRWLDKPLPQKLIELDKMVDRLWAVYYPALAISRVPADVPHENGAILVGAVKHILMPRFLFPHKAPLESDSDKVFRYAGVKVAGAKQKTTIAFGYVAESYVDFGLPGMFAPIFVFGLLMGVSYQWFRAQIHHRDLAIAFVTLSYWLSLYLFERSWVRNLGLSITTIVCLGVGTILLDRLLLAASGKRIVATRPRTGSGVLPAGAGFGIQRPLPPIPSGAGPGN
ncbi:MAG: oligosaccharide repeat unit polymerase [Planctomycetes bacterium]|nr:oligosaccharide repeat unit polymerase [Planctomycetota bacterium]